MTFIDCHVHSSIRDVQPQHPLWINSQGPQDWQSLVESHRSDRDKKILDPPSSQSRLFLGMHPWNLGPGGTGELARLEDLLRSNPDIGLGEIGLDRGPKARDWQEQEEIFLGQCALAEKYSRPMALHLYKTWQDFFRLAPKIAHQLPVMIHGFTASVELAGQLIKRGCYLSVGWRSLAKGQLWLEELLKLIPREKILAESDYHGDPPLTLEAYQKKMEDLYAALASAGSMEIEGWKEQIHGNAAVFKNGADDRSQGSAVPGT